MDTCKAASFKSCFSKQIAQTLSHGRVIVDDEDHFFVVWVC